MKPPRQQAALALIAISGPHGATWREVASNLGTHHGSASAALTNLNQAGKVVCLQKRRDGCHVYVLPAFAGDDPVRPPSVPISERLSQARAEGEDAGWQAGYDAAMVEAATRDDDVLMVTAHQEGLAAGRLEEATALLRFIDALRNGIRQERGIRVVTHNNTCWMDHPDCALRAIERSLRNNMINADVREKEIAS